METYLLPIRRDRHELYCEFDDREPPAASEERPGWRRWLSRRFHEGLAALEAERRKRLARASAAPARTRAQRVKDRLMGFVAERVAEQRLLWILRSRSDATVHFPDDAAPADAERAVRGILHHDARYHFVWMFVDALLYLATVPLTPIPGPNVLSLYFSFRAIGHLLSWLGARQGLHHVRWRFVPNAPLTELRRLGALSGEERAALARDVAARLGLRHLDTFVSRMSLAGR